MKPYTLKLFEPDLDRRDILVAHYSKLWGRKARYSEVLRQLQQEKIDELVSKSLKDEGYLPADK